MSWPKSRRKHVKPERKFLVIGHWECPSADIFDAYVNEKTVAVSEKEALNNVRHQLREKHNLFFKGLPRKINFANDVEVKEVRSNVASTTLNLPLNQNKPHKKPIEKGDARPPPHKKGGPGLPFDQDE